MKRFEVQWTAFTQSYAEMCICWENIYLISWRLHIHNCPRKLIAAGVFKIEFIFLYAMINLFCNDVCRNIFRYSICNCLKYNCVSSVEQTLISIYENFSIHIVWNISAVRFSDERQSYPLWHVCMFIRFLSRHILYTTFKYHSK